MICDAHDKQECINKQKSMCTKMHAIYFGVVSNVSVILRPRGFAK
jgi:hypothetical protein